MVVLDPRLLDLIETLTAARMGWLAFELIGAIQSGRSPTDTPDMLALTRRRVREGGQPRPTGQPKLLTEEPQLIEGDDQIDWAVKYVAERLDTTLAYLTQSIENIDAVTNSDAENPAATSRGVGEPLVVLIDGEVEKRAGQPQVEAAISALPQLRHSLEAWSAQVREQSKI